MVQVISFHNATEALASEAFLNGRRAGLAGSSSSLAPSQSGSPEYQNWMDGWRSGNREYVSKLGRACPYKRGVTCEESCNGRAFCLEIA